MPNDTFAIDTRHINVPHLADYFGVWAIQQEPFLAACRGIESIDLHAHVQTQQKRRRRSKPQAAAEGGATPSASSQFGYSLAPGGIAVVELSGPLMKHASSLSGGTSTLRARRAIRNAVNDETVSAILLHVDSPGGTVAGTKDLADDVAKAREHKPVHAYCEDLCASAAYWVASQADKVYSNATALVGSIGTFMVVYDLSKLAEAEGVQVHVIRAGDFKGVGTPGTEITEEHLSEFQRVVNELNAHFLAGVSSGRSMDAKAVKTLADGRLHVGKEAKAQGLTDGVKSIDEVLEGLRRGRGRSSSKGGSAAQGGEAAQENPMSDAPTTPAAPAAATYQQIVAACPKADEKFICSQLAAGATVDVARNAWTESLATRLEASEKALAEKSAAGADTEPPAGGKTKPGVKALDSRPAAGNAAEVYSGDALADFNARVGEKMAAGLPRRKAVLAVAKADPELHRAFLEETNPKRKQRALIADRFDDE